MFAAAPARVAVPSLQIRRYPRDRSHSFRTVRDLDASPPDVHPRPDAWQSCPPGWLPSWLPAVPPAATQDDQSVCPRVTVAAPGRPSYRTQHAHGPESGSCCAWLFVCSRLRDGSHPIHTRSGSCSELARVTCLPHLRFGCPALGRRLVYGRVAWKVQSSLSGSGWWLSR
jgi:hypothetical protein